MAGGSLRPASCGFLTYACTSSGGAAPEFDGFGTGGIAFTEGKRPGLGLTDLPSQRYLELPAPTQ